MGWFWFISRAGPGSSWINTIPGDEYMGPPSQKKKKKAQEIDGLFTEDGLLTVEEARSIARSSPQALYLMHNRESE